MKKLLLIVSIVTALFSANLDWPSDYEQALKDAKSQGKLVYVFIVSDNCQWCKKFANTTLQDRSVQKRLFKEFIPIYMSRDQHQIPKQFEIAPVPRHYFTDAQGNILYSSLGHRGVTCFDAFMDNAQNKLKVSQ